MFSKLLTGPRHWAFSGTAIVLVMLTQTCFDNFFEQSPFLMFIGGFFSSFGTDMINLLNKSKNNKLICLTNIRIIITFTFVK